MFSHSKFFQGALASFHSTSSQDRRCHLIRSRSPSGESVPDIIGFVNHEPQTSKLNLFGSSLNPLFRDGFLLQLEEVPVVCVVETFNGFQGINEILPMSHLFSRVKRFDSSAFSVELWGVGWRVAGGWRREYVGVAVTKKRAFDKL